MMRFLLAAILVSLVSACSIKTAVNPVSIPNLSFVCIVENDAVMMDGFLPTLQSLTEERGIKTKVISGTNPEGCKHVMEYTANWRWDMAMYLFFAEVKVVGPAGLIGTATYDARNGGANMGKFGSTRSKIEPLIRKLFP